MKTFAVNCDVFVVLEHITSVVLCLDGNCSSIDIHSDANKTYIYELTENDAKELFTNLRYALEAL